MKRSGIHKYVLWAIFAVMLTAASCLADPPVIRLAHAPHDHHAALYVAASNPEYFRNNGGIYLKEKIRKKEYQLIDNTGVLASVLIDSSSGGGEIIRKLSEDQYDLAFGGFPSMVQAIDDGKPIKVIAPLMTGGSSLIIAGDYKITSWRQLISYLKTPGKKPLRIGHQAAGSVQSLALTRALQKEGIPLASDMDDPKAKLILVDLHGPKNFLSALKGRVVDGFIAMQPYPAAALSQKAGTLVAVLQDFTDNKGSGLYPCCALAAREAFIGQHGEIASKLLKLIMTANNFLVHNPREGAVFVAAWLDEKVEVEEASLPTISFITSFNDEWRRGAREWVSGMVASGALKGRVKKAYDSGDATAVLYDDQLLKRIKLDH